MKKSFLIKGLIAILIVLVFGLSTVGCINSNPDDPKNNIEAVAGANKELKLNPGAIKEIALADYVDDKGLSKVTYEVKASNALVSLSPISNGKFTITAGEVNETTDLTVSIFVYYDGNEKLKVEIAVQVTNDPIDSPSDFVPDDNVDTDW